MDSPDPPNQRRRPRPRVIVGEKANGKTASTGVHNQHGEIDMDSPLLAKAAKASRRGPRRSIFQWFGVTIIIKLFRLSVKLVPVALALVMAVYGYTYFFGSIPVVDAIKRQLGMEVAPTEAEESRVAQMLQQTKDAVAASDSRVNLGNAIAAGDVATADAIESGDLLAAVAGGEPAPSAPAAPTGSAAPIKITLDKPDVDAAGSVVGDAIDGLLSAFEGSETPNTPADPTPATDSPPAQTMSRQITIVGDANESSPYKTYPRTVTVVQNSRQAIPSRYHNVNLQGGRPASAQFTDWLRSIRVNEVIADYRPKVIINGTEFVSGNIVDFALGITFAGLARDGTLLVFKDDKGAILTAEF